MQHKVDQRWEEKNITEVKYFLDAILRICCKVTIKTKLLIKAFFELQNYSNCLNYYKYCTM